MKIRLLHLAIAMLVLISQTDAKEKFDKGVCREEIKSICGEVKGEERKSCISHNQQRLSPECQTAKKKTQESEKKKGKKKKVTS